MISDIPSHDDFFNEGISLLSFAWDTVVNLLTDLSESEYYGIDISEVGDAFWLSSKQTLTTSLAIAQQGVEFILKGKIAEVSPFLLIAGNPKDWPKQGDGQPLSFSEFMTIDAQDLVKVHDTVATVKLENDFKIKYQELRKKRNTIIHTVNKNLTIHVTDVIVDILEVHKALFPGENWVCVRREFLENSPTSQLHSTDWVEQRVIWEFSIITDLLQPKHMYKFFGFNKKQRRYMCPNCYHVNVDAQLKPRTAVLNPNTPESTTLYCYVCDEFSDVERVNCSNADCPGNVISVDYGECATCLTSVE